MSKTKNYALICGLLAVCITLQGCGAQIDAIKAAAANGWNTLVAKGCSEGVQTIIATIKAKGLEELNKACSAAAGTGVTGQCVSTGTAELNVATADEVAKQETACIAMVNNFTATHTDFSQITTAIASFSEKDGASIKAEFQAFVDKIIAKLKTTATETAADGAAENKTAEETTAAEETEAVCTVPTTTGYNTGSAGGAVTRTGFNPTGVTCAASYTGAVVYTVCSSAGQAYSLSGCEATRLFVLEPEFSQKEQAATYNMPLVLLAGVFAASALIGVALYVRHTRSSPQVAEEDDCLE